MSPRELATKQNRSIELLELISLNYSVMNKMNKPQMYHINEECVDFKVRILLSVPDDTGLHHATSTLNLQAGGCHTGQLEALQVTQPPCQDLKWSYTESHIICDIICAC